MAQHSTFSLLQMYSANLLTFLQKHTLHFLCNKGCMCEYTYFLNLLFYIGLQLIYNVVLVSDVQQRVVQLYTYMYLCFFKFFSHLDYYRAPSRVPCAIVGPC